MESQKRGGKHGGRRMEISCWMGRVGDQLRTKGKDLSMEVRKGNWARARREKLPQPMDSHDEEKYVLEWWG
jgi:hypothetical protein